MDGFLLYRTDRPAYVAPPGSLRSYTRSPHLARVYPNRAAAEADRCVMNEVAIPVSQAR